MRGLPDLVDHRRGVGAGGHRAAAQQRGEAGAVALHEVQVAAHHPVQPLGQRAVGRLLEPGGQLPAGPPQRLLVDRLLAREVVVDQRPGGARGGGDVVDRHLLRRAVAEQLQRDGDQLLAPLVDAQPPARPRGLARPGRLVRLAGSGRPARPDGSARLARLDRRFRCAGRRGPPGALRTVAARGRGGGGRRRAGCHARHPIGPGQGRSGPVRSGGAPGSGGTPPCRPGRTRPGPGVRPARPGSARRARPPRTPAGPPARPTRPRAHRTTS